MPDSADKGLGIVPPNDEEEQAEISFWHKISPLAVFGLCLLVETVIVLWACGLFEPWASRSHNYEPFTRTSVNYVEPYLGRAPQLYDGNWTTMRQGRVFVVTFSLPILSCDFLAEKDKYVQAIADAHSVPASEVTLMEPRSCPNAAAGAVDSNQQIRMHVAVNDLEQAVQQLELDLSDKWKKDPLNKNPAGQVQKGQADYPDKDGATADRINFHMLANEGEQLSDLRITFLTDAYHGGSPDEPYRNVLPGAPISFLRVLLSGNSSSLVRCVWPPLASTWKDPDCQYLDNAMSVSIWGLFIVPGIVILAGVAFLVGRHVRELPCSPVDRSIPLHPRLQMFSCYECGGREPTMLYSPARQLCCLAILIVIVFFVFACGILAMVGAEHWALSMQRASSAVSASRQLDRTLRASYDGEVAALQKETVDFFMDRNRVFDEVAAFADTDLPKLDAAIRRLRDRVQQVAVFVEGCRGSTRADSCDMRNASVVHRHNACSKRHFPVYNGSLDAHNSSTGPPGKGTASNLVLLSNVSRWYHPEGHAMTFVRGGVQTSPACSGGTCPCCSLCHETIAAIDAQLRWTSKSKELRDRLTNPWVKELVSADVREAAEPLKQPLALLRTFTELFDSATAGFRQLEADTRQFRAVVNHGGWSFGLVSLIFLPISIIAGSLALNQCGLVCAFIAVIMCWEWWAVMGLALYPHADLCDALLPASIGNVSLVAGQLRLPVVRGAQRNVVRRPQSDLLFYSAHLEPGYDYYTEDETRRWIDGRPGLSRANASAFRRLFDGCVLDRGSVVWEGIAYPQANIAAVFDDWGVYDRVSRSVLETELGLAARLQPLKDQVKVVLAAQVDAALGYNGTMVTGLPEPLKGEFVTYQAALAELLAGLRDDAIRLETSMTAAEAAANVVMASFGFSAVQSSDYIRSTVERLIFMASCAPLNDVYEAVRSPLCDGARRAIDTIFLASMCAAIMLLPLLPIGLQTLKHARQRLRDARHPLVNVLMAFDFKHFRRTRYMREKELEKVRAIISEGRAAGDKPGEAAHGVHHKYPTYGEDLVYVEYGKGVDGWGHDANDGVTPAHELEPPLFPGKSRQFDYLADHMIKGPAEASGLHDSTVVSRLDKGNLYDGRDKRQLERDPRTGKLRWIEPESKKRSGPVTVEDAVLKLYSAIAREHGSLDERELPAMIMELFRKIDEDGSGAIAKPELKAALEELGMFPSNSEINQLMQAYDSSGEGLLDLPDFRSLILSAMDLGKSRSSANNAQPTVSTTRAAPMLSSAGRRHPATRRVRYDAKGAEQVDSSEEDEEEEGEYFPDEVYIRQIFQDLDKDGNGMLDEAELRVFGETLGLDWDDNFAKDIILAIDADGGGTIDVDEFWEWYKRWSRQKQAKTSFVMPVSIGYTNPPALTEMRRERARLRLQKMGNAMSDQIQNAISIASAKSAAQGQQQGAADGGFLNTITGGFLGGDSRNASAE